MNNSSNPQKKDFSEKQIKPIPINSEDGNEYELIAPDLTEEEKEILDQLRQDMDLRDQIPPEERFLMTNLDKYSFPVGMDDQGNLNVVRGRRKSQES
jgi:site-specific DNA-adenine methylase